MDPQGQGGQEGPFTPMGAIPMGGDIPREWGEWGESTRCTMDSLPLPPYSPPRSTRVLGDSGGEMRGFLGCLGFQFLGVN